MPNRAGATGEGTRPARQLRALLNGGRPAIAVGAHDALSARLVAEAGFDAVWGSGFGISTVRAVPDANILTMTEMLEAVGNMVETVPIPVLADCDSGYGNAINVMRTVREFSRAGAAGLCLEDNIFPKRCSFYDSVQREIVPAEEHADKIRAAQSAKVDPDFVIIARTEAFIAGEGLDAALARAHAYAEAGADAILVHSKAPTFDELRAFAARWDHCRPLVAVPTTYGDVAIDELAASGFRMVIFANQVLRSAIRAMRSTLTTLAETRCAGSVESAIVPLSEVYEIVGLPELQRHEREYLGGQDALAAVIIAAGFEPELMPLIHDRPKGMLEVQGESILGHQLRALRDSGIRDIAIVRGHQKEAINFPNVRYYDNARYRESGELASLRCAREALGGRFVFLYSDILFDQSILARLLRATEDVVLVVDRAFAERPADEAAARHPDLVVTDTAAPLGHRFVPNPGRPRVRRLGRRIEPARASGEFIGMALFSARGAAWLRAACDDLMGHRGPFQEAGSWDHAAFTDIVSELIERGHPVHSVETYKGWSEIDSFEDYRRAWGLGGSEGVSATPTAAPRASR